MKRRKHRRTNKRGSFLIEVILTIVILSISLTVIIQSLMSSLRVTVYSAGYTTAILLMENKIFELVHQSPQDLLTQEKGPFKKPYAQYTYDVKISSLDAGEDLDDLREISLDVFWKSGGKKKNISLSTLQMEPQNE